MKRAHIGEEGVVSLLTKTNSSKQDKIFDSKTPPTDFSLFHKSVVMLFSVIFFSFSAKQPSIFLPSHREGSKTIHAIQNFFSTLAYLVMWPYGPTTITPMNEDNFPEKIQTIFLFVNVLLLLLLLDYFCDSFFLFHLMHLSSAMFVYGRNHWPIFI